jgi:hypothetical protein
VNDVPLLVRLSLGNFGYFADTQANGADLRFVAADDVTPLRITSSPTIRRARWRSSGCACRT